MKHTNSDPRDSGDAVVLADASKSLQDSMGASQNSGMDLQGNIENFKLPDILQLLSHSRKSGTLGIQRDADIVMIYFREGSIIYSYGPRKASHIGQLLKERGRINASQLNAAVATQNAEDGDRRLGQILMETGVIDRADIIEVVREQIEDLLFSLMSWESGSFKFYENQFPTDEEVTVDLSTENVILEGLRRLDEMNHLKDTLPRVDQPLLIAQAAAGYGVNIELSPEEWNLLALIDSRRTIADIVEISNLNEVDTLKKLAALKLAGLISEAEVPAEQSEDGASTPATANLRSSSQLNGMMQKLSGLLEDFLVTDRTMSPTVSTGGGSRMVDGAPLSEIISESVVGLSELATTDVNVDVDSPTVNSPEESGKSRTTEGPEDRLWNEFTQ